MKPCLPLRPARSALRLALAFLAAALLVGLTLGLAAAGNPFELTRVTTTSSDDRSSEEPSLSADGRRVAFSSDSDFFGQGIPDNQSEIWLYDTATMTVTRITTASAADRASYRPSLSADGRRIAFHSDSDFLGQGIPRQQFEVWLYDMEAQTVTRVTTASPSLRDSYQPSLSADGRRIAFHSDSDFRGQGVAPYQYEIWLYDTATMTLTRVTTASPAGRASYGASLNADGRRIAFSSNSDFLSQGIPGHQFEIWRYDAATQSLTRVTAASAPGRGSRTASLSADGRRIAFVSNSDFLGQGIPASRYEIWLHDTETMTAVRVTSASATYRESEAPSLSSDGRRIAFESDSDFLSQGVQDNQVEIWLYDTTTLTLTRVTTASSSNRASYEPSLSGDGRRIAFYSDSDFLGQGIPAGMYYEIWWAGTRTPALTVTKSVNDSTLQPGQAVTYTVVVRNAGDAAATGAVVSDALDSRLVWQGSAVLDPPGAGTLGSPPHLVSGLTISAGARVTLTFRALVTTSGVLSGARITNRAAVTCAQAATPALGAVDVIVGGRSAYLPVVRRQ